MDERGSGPLEGKEAFYTLLLVCDSLRGETAHLGWVPVHACVCYCQRAPTPGHVRHHAHVRS